MQASLCICAAARWLERLIMGGRGQAQNSERCNASARREMGCQYMGWSLHSFAGIGADALALSISIGVAPNMPQAAWSRLFGSNV